MRLTEFEIAYCCGAAIAFFCAGLASMASIPVYVAGGLFATLTPLGIVIARRLH